MALFSLNVVLNSRTLPVEWTEMAPPLASSAEVMMVLFSNVELKVVSLPWTLIDPPVTAILLLKTEQG